MLLLTVIGLDRVQVNLGHEELGPGHFVHVGVVFLEQVLLLFVIVAVFVTDDHHLLHTRRLDSLNLSGLMHLHHLGQFFDFLILFYQLQLHIGLILQLIRFAVFVIVAGCCFVCFVDRSSFSCPLLTATLTLRSDFVFCSSFL